MSSFAEKLKKLVNPDPRTAKIMKRMKELEKSKKHSLMLSEYFAELDACKRAFENTILVERCNVLERRERRINDAIQKRNIHDAAIGLLAVEEARLDMRSAGMSMDFSTAFKKLELIMFRLELMNRNAGISAGELREHTSLEFDSSTATISFSDRAELVDEQFVENLIAGYTMTECLDMKTPGSNSSKNNIPSGDIPNFSTGNAEEDEKLVQEVLRKSASVRLD